ncbi:hypothetical protein C2869_04650 [Saccharobesus litoralis]|uniref:Uncharacterized protein n=1 Tax=Saccharobesus litoralis TaxID=2172099 RepID=A0A2S0VNG5_9ALTE|nr:hypothetical protein C2869_04650 [Saccharobesus litoralis]
MLSSHKKFSKPIYTLIFWLSIGFTVSLFLLVIFFHHLGMINDQQKLLYFAIIIAQNFLLELIFALIVKEVSSLEGVIKKSENAIYFNLRLCISVLGVLVGVFLALNRI